MGNLDADRLAVKLDGHPKDGVRVDVGGHIDSVLAPDPAHPEMFVLTFHDCRHKKRTLEFTDPAGFTPSGEAIPHDLRAMVDLANANGEKQFHYVKDQTDTNFAVWNDKTLERGHGGPSFATDVKFGDPRPAPLDPAIANPAYAAGVHWLRELGPAIGADGLADYGGMNVAGTITGYSDRNGIKTITFDDRFGKPEVVRFSDPHGVDEHGVAIRHPFGPMLEQFEHNVGKPFALDVSTGSGDAALSLESGISSFGSPDYAKSHQRTPAELAVPIPPPGSDPPARHVPAKMTVDDLLTPRGGPVYDHGRTYVTLGYPEGSLRIDARVFDDFVKAQKYLAQSPEALDTLYNLSHPQVSDPKHPPPHVTVEPAHALGATKFDPQNATIAWSRHGAMGEPGQPATSPALQLFRETGHALEWQQHPQEFARGKIDYKDTELYAAWTNPEAWRNARAEQRVAHDLGEPFRERDVDYSPANFVRVDDPTTHGSPAGPPKDRSEAGVEFPRAAIKINGFVEHAGGYYEGTVTNVSDRNGIKTIELDHGRNTIEFGDPAGFNARGEPIPHPLAGVVANAREHPGAMLQLEIDATQRSYAATLDRKLIVAGGPDLDAARDHVQNAVSHVISWERATPEKDCVGGR